MKNFIFSLTAIISGVLAFGQAPDRPESIIWDDGHSRYLISNHGNGNNGSIISYYPQRDSFAWFNQQETTGPKGLAIYNNVLYVSDNGFVNGFDLDSRHRVFYKKVGNNMINDLVVDKAGFLYLGHRDESRIYKINTENSQITEWVSTEDIYEINGLYIDSINNRLIACFTRQDSPIMAFDLETGKQTVLMETSYSILDGIARDNCGYYYISCHGKQAILKFDPDFMNPPEVFLDGYQGPADIFFNSKSQQLCIPEIEGSDIVFEELFQSCLAPEQVFPADGEEGTACTSLCLRWKQVFRADYYRLEVSSDPGFNNLVVIDGTPDTSYLIGSLETSTEYFWRISAYWKNQHTDYSPVFTFITESSSSVFNPQTQTRFRLFPNPASEILNLEWQESPPEWLCIYSIGGQLLLRRKLDLDQTSQSLSIPLDIIPGSYLLTISGRNFHNTYPLNVVK